jgi:FkbM family methyltransferase
LHQLNRIEDLLVIDLFKLIIGKFGLRISRQAELFNFRLARHIQRLDVVTVLDVGANIGQFYFELKVAGFDGHVISFEPLPDAHQQLMSISSKEPNWRIYDRIALGSTEEFTKINVANNSASSSIRPQTELMKQNAPYANKVSQVDITVTTLDKVMNSIPLSNCALKIDTQGYELEVLKGSSKLLERVKLVSLELSLVELYEGQAKYYHIDEYLRSHGFKLIDLYPGFKNFDTGELFEYDAIYEKMN